MKLKKKIQKNTKTSLESTLVNLLNLSYETEITQYKKNYEAQFPINPILKDEIKKKIN